MKIFCTGASGYIGGSVAAHLARAGHQVIGLVRSADKVARQGYQAFVQGRPLVVPGLGNKILASLPRVLPRKLTAGLVEASQRNRRRTKSGEWPRRRQGSAE